MAFVQSIAQAVKGLFPWHSAASSAEASDAGKDKRVAPMVFTPNQKAACNAFAAISDRAAWYCMQASDGATAATKPKAMLAVTINEEITFSVNGICEVLRPGGALMMRADKQIVALQPEAFNTSYARCFSDGTEICKLNASQMDQAVALSRSNSQIRVRIQEMSDPTVWDGIAQIVGKGQSAAAKQISDWNLQVHAHIQDLTMRHKLKIG